MQTIMSAEELAAWHFGCDEPSKAQVNTITKMCRDGTIRNAQKFGREWKVNCTAEWPLLFPDEDRPDPLDPTIVFGEMLVAVGKMVIEGRNRG